MSAQLEDKPHGQLAPGSADANVADGTVVQGLLLSLLAILPTMGAVLIVPVLPLFERAFGSVDGIAIIAPVMLTLPALCIGLLSPMAGAVADRFGRRRLLIGALVVYGVAGVAPTVLDSLPLIIISRLIVGISEAAIMTCCTTLIGDYFFGPARERWLSNQSAVVAIGATLLFVLGGALGAFGWRTPFLAYGVAILLALLVVVLLPEPPPSDIAVVAPAFPWKPFRAFIALAAVAAIAFYAVPVQLGFLLGGIGVESPPTIGLLAALESLSVAVGSFSFRFVSRLSGPALIAVAGVVAGGGFLFVGHATSVPPMIAGLVLNGLGTGLLLPTLLAMAMEHLPFSLRGRGTGMYMGAFFIGQFVSPIIVTVLGKSSGRLADAMTVLGWFSLAAGCLGIFMQYRNRNRVPISRGAR